MRNVFDQYQQPENRLTHALVTTLSHERKLIRPFLRWLGVTEIPPERDIHLVEQQVPGIPIAGDEGETQGLPDACLYNDDGWAVLIEAKVQAPVRAGQLRRHHRTAKRFGYPDPHLIVLSTDRARKPLPHQARLVEWCEVYSWFRRHAGSHPWARLFVDYLQVFESRMIAQNYTIRGTLTMFDGFHFGEDNPYTYAEGKRIIRLLADELRKRKDLKDLGIDPKAPGRTAITGRSQEAVWDFIALKTARGANSFTAYPHLTMTIGREGAGAAVTVPNGVKGGFRTKLKEEGVEGFWDLMTDLEKRLRPVINKSTGAKPMVYVVQRHYRSQRSVAAIDGRLAVDLRTTRRRKGDMVKYQPQWIEAVYELLVNKRSNIQLGLDVRFSYDCPVVRSRRVADLFAQTWVAAGPLLDFVLQPAE